MRIAIISDTHMGDTKSVMAFRESTTDNLMLGSKYQEFKEKIKKKFNGKELDYLVLLGDILDFSISSYSETYAIGQFFFQSLKDDRIAREIIYIPGNHDYDLWHVVEYQVNVTNRLRNGKLPELFRMSVPGIIDDREGGPIKGFVLHNVTARKEKNKPRYAGLFLDDITSPPTPFNFVYPNLYLVTEDETVLISHGQYLEIYWSVLGKWGLKIINGDLDTKDQNLLDLKEMVAINFPMCQLNSSGLGQAGPLTAVVQKIEHETKVRHFTRLETYFYRLDLEIKKQARGISRFLQRCALKAVKHELLKGLSKAKYSRHREGFLQDPKVCERVRDYYSSSIYEICEIREKYDTDIPFPTSMIFGHTHQPIPWGSERAPVIEVPQLPEGKALTMYNTGGWLIKMDKNNVLQFSGAEIFFYETGKGFSSESVGYTP